MPNANECTCQRQVTNVCVSTNQTKQHHESIQVAPEIHIKSEMLTVM